MNASFYSRRQPGEWMQGCSAYLSCYYQYTSFGVQKGKIESDAGARAASDGESRTEATTEKYSEYYLRRVADVVDLRRDVRLETAAVGRVVRLRARGQYHQVRGKLDCILLPSPCYRAMPHTPPAPFPRITGKGGDKENVKISTSDLLHLLSSAKHVACC
jgi:hypothetical protein